jgi:HTH-type transcriptional regulator, sugar sensing transcriptional regulator
LLWKKHNTFKYEMKSITMSKETDVLTAIGLEEREARIYIALLRLGVSTATKLSEDVNIDRTTIYDILNRLINKGIVSYVINDNIRCFSAISPQQLLKELQDKEEELKDIVPRLAAISKKEKEKTTVEVFKGKGGITTIFKMILRERKNYVFIGAGQQISEAVPIPLYKFLKEAHKLKLSGKLLLEEGFGESELDIVGKRETYKIISKDFTSTSTFVWGGKTAFLVFSEPYYTILIESKEISDRHRLYFDYLWGQAKEPSKSERVKTSIKYQRR